MDLSNCEPVSHQGNTNEWYTPRWILDACGEFDLDPCGDKRWKTADLIYETKGLDQDWFGRVWMNPPYGRDVGKWVEKFVEHGNGITLLFARTDTQWFQKYGPYFEWIIFIAGRVKFVESGSLEITKNNPGAPSMLCGINSEIPKIKGQLYWPDDSYGFNRKVDS